MPLVQEPAVANRRTRADPAIGDLVLGHFRLQTVIGRGSFATAYLAFDERRVRPAVVKVTHANLLTGPRAEVVRRRFSIEVRALAAVLHPNLVEIYAAGLTPGGLPAIAMAYLPGETLEAALLGTAGPLALPAVLSLGGQLASALLPVHEHGIVHRDVSPQNIIWGRDAQGEPMAHLLDFGVAKFLSEHDTLTAVGTPQYMAPEQIRGHVHAKSDIYALGAILWWAATGRSFVADERDDRARQAHALNPSLPPVLTQLLARMLSTRPADRPSARDLVGAWPDLQAEAMRSAQQPVALPPTDRLRVALVDDNPFTARQTERLLDRKACAVELFTSPRPLTRGRAADFDLVIVSEDLESVDAHDIVDYLVHTWPTVPVIITRGAGASDATPPARADVLGTVSVPMGLHTLEQLLVRLDPGAFRDAADDPIVQFIGDFPQWCCEIEAAAQRGDAAGVVTWCQQVQARCLTVGATHVARIAAVLGALCEDGELQVVSGFVAELEAAFQTSFPELMATRERNARASTQPPRTIRP